jgi:hypothetical protein
MAAPNRGYLKPVVSADATFSPMDKRLSEEYLYSLRYWF